MLLCDLTTCYSNERAWFQRLKVKYDEALSNSAFNFNLRRYNEEDVMTQNHKAVWGSFWQSGQWGYSCCRSFQKNSYCTGIRGIEAGSSHHVPMLLVTWRAPVHNVPWWMT